MFSSMGDDAVKKKDQRVGAAYLPAIHRRLVSLGVDVPLLLVTVVLVVFGLMMVYSASTDFSLRVYGSANQIFVRQVQVLMVAFIVATIFSIVDYHIICKFALPALLLTIALLVFVLFVSDERHGAVRTLWDGSIQPSELAKIVIIIYLSVWLYSKQEYLQDIYFGLVPLSVILGIVGGLIIIQPDISAVLTIMVIGGTMFFLAGGDTKQILIMVVLALFVGLIVVVTSTTGSQRLANFLPGLFDPLEAPYHVRRSLEAFYRGRWFGVGLGNADTKLTGLPVPHTDSIFAVVGEELGTVGSVLLVGLYMVLMWRGMGIARRAKDQLGALLAAGLSIWLVMEAVINMMVMINLLPFAGNALPFISAGGSNLLVSLAAIGLLINISRLSVNEKDANEGISSSVVDLRRGDRRGRLSSARRPSGISQPHQYGK